MKRTEMINVVGNDFNTTNIEGGEYSYVKEAGSNSATYTYNFTTPSDSFFFINRR